MAVSGTSRGLGGWAGSTLQAHGALVALAVLAGVSAWRSETFARPENLLNILRDAAPTGVIALGLTFVIIAGGIDLSVGSAMALVGGLAILAMNAVLEAGRPEWVGVAAAVGTCLAAGAAAGLVNGVLIAKGRLAPFIATLGTMAAYRSLAQALVDAGEFRSASASLFGRIAQSGVARFQIQRVIETDEGPVTRAVTLRLFVPIVVFAGLALLSGFLLRATRFGRHVVAVGSNERAAVYSGIRTDRVKLLTYTLAGVFAGVGALLLASRMNSVSSSQAGLGSELDAIAAVVIGGTLMRGGRGTVYGTVVGVLLLQVVNNMLVMFDVSSYFQGLVKGLIVVAAVLLQRGRREV